MIIVKNISDLNNIISDQSSKTSNIGLVPTMGSLHEGHLALIRDANKKCDIVWVSIFVNPTQFNDLNDYNSYPNELENDIKKIRTISSKIYVFCPSVSEIYNNGVSSEKFNFNDIDKVLEGKYRPGHFNGVATIVKKLFKAIKPLKVFFGEKDFQQIIIIKQIINSYFPKITLITCPTVRNNDGLALSSRNKLISKKAINESGIIFETLLFVKNNFVKNSYKQLIKNVKQKIEDISNFKLEYFEIRESETLNPYDEKNKKNSYRAFICVKVEGIRLIDNLLIN